MDRTTDPGETRRWWGGRVVRTLALVVVWWALVLPLGLFLRLVGVDLMRRKVRRGSAWKTYRIKRGPG